MYRYDEFDHQFVRQRTEQFRDQAERRLKGELTEDEFRPLRLMNGLYLQLHAYMLRVAIPYGTLSGRQMRRLVGPHDLVAGLELADHLEVGRAEPARGRGLGTAGHNGATAARHASRCSCVSSAGQIKD